jgi:hypothetical protein
VVLSNLTLSINLVKSFPKNVSIYFSDGKLKNRIQYSRDPAATGKEFSRS